MDAQEAHGQAHEIHMPSCCSTQFVLTWNMVLFLSTPKKSYVSKSQQAIS